MQIGGQNLRAAHLVGLFRKTCSYAGGMDEQADDLEMTMPTQIAKAIARPPTIVRRGYFTSIRPPSFRSSQFIELLLRNSYEAAPDFVPQ
jgi:hypothetical protein